MWWKEKHAVAALSIQPVRNAMANGLASSKTPTRMCREQFAGAAPAAAGWAAAAPARGWAADAAAARAARAASAFVARLITKALLLKGQGCVRLISVF